MNTEKMEHQRKRFARPEMEMNLATCVTIIPMTAEMIPEVANLHFEAFAGYMNTRIGTPYVKAFLTWFLQAECAIALVAASSDNKIIGYVVGAPLGYGKALSLDLWGVAVTGLVVRPWLFLSAQFRSAIAERLRLIVRRSRAEQVDPRLPKPVMSLVGIGVSRAARGRKVGLGLVRAFEVRARQLQMRSLELSVYPDNMVARQLYEGCGWQPLSGSTEGKKAMHYFRIIVEESDQDEARL